MPPLRIVYIACKKTGSQDSYPQESGTTSTLKNTRIQKNKIFFRTLFEQIKMENATKQLSNCHNAEHA
jgi:hypothetical protein